VRRARKAACRPAGLTNTHVACSSAAILQIALPAFTHFFASGGHRKCELHTTLQRRALGLLHPSFMGGTASATRSSMSTTATGSRTCP
jgi:hypothetical protein